MSQAAESPADGPDKLDEEITAYLDGELSFEEARQFEQRLADKDDVRERVQTFQQSWEVLDQLPRNEAGSQFAASTVELVAISADPTQDSKVGSWTRRWLRQWVIVGLSITAACLGGFAVTAAAASLLRAMGVIEDANDHLVSDLPMLESLDKYELVGSLDLLRELHRRAAHTVGDLGATTAADGGDVAGQDAAMRRQRIADMSSTDKQRLAINQERFSQYPPEKQDQLRRFHAQLSQDPQAALLRRTLELYYEWYKQLPAEKRAELRIAPEEQLADQIARLRTEQRNARERLRVMGDIRAVVRWSEQMAVKYQEQLLGGMTSQRRREILRSGEAVKRRRLTALFWQQWHNSANAERLPAERLPMDQADMQLLTRSLSPELRQKLEPASDVQSARRVLLAALPRQFVQLLARNGTALADVAGPDGARPAWLRMAPIIRDDTARQQRLMEYFRNELSTQEQERLKRMPRDEAMKYLQARYLRNYRKGKNAPRGPFPGGATRVAPRPQSQSRNLQPTPPSQ